MISTIVLDLDGPLLEGRARHYTCYSQILNEWGLCPIEIETYWQGKRAKMDRRTLLKMSDAIEYYDQFLREWIRRIELPEMLALDQLQPEVLSILSGWKDSNIELVVATMRNNAPNTLDQLKSLGVIPIVDQVFVTGTDDGSGGKVEAVRNVVTGKSSETVLWVGDTEVDVHAARSLNVRVCALTCGLRTEELLASENPDYLLGDLRDVRELIKQ